MSKLGVLSRRTYVGETYNFLSGKTIKEVIKCLQEYILDGWSEESKFDVDPYSEYKDIELFEYRLETDEEEQIRLNKEAAAAEKQMKKKLEEYEKLKKELGL